MPAVSNPSLETVYTLSLHVSPTLFKAMNHLRQTYFPPHLNRLDAHVTLFHALPLSHLHSDIVPLIQDLAAQTPSYHIRASPTKRIGKGVIIPMHHSARPHVTMDLHGQMQRAWSHFLSKQDQQNPRLHWTVMNKVDDVEEVKRVEKEVNEWLERQKRSQDDYELQKVEGWATGLTLWRYKKGLWVDSLKFELGANNPRRRKEADEWLQRQRSRVVGDDAGPGKIMNEKQPETVADPKQNLAEHFFEQEVRRERQRQKEAVSLPCKIRKVKRG